MSRLTLPLLVVLCLLVALGLTWWALRDSGPPGAGATGGGIAAHDLAPFHRIEVSGNAEVALRQGGAERLEVETPPRGVTINAEVRDGTVHLSVRDTRRWWNNLFNGPRRPTRLTLVVRAVDDVSLNGAVSLMAAALDAPELRLSASGGTRVRIDALRGRLLRVDGNGALKAQIAGSVSEQRISISGAGEYDAGRLASDTASVSVSGVGKVLVNVSRMLDAEISGAGTIEYLGDPEVRRSVSGVGRIRRRDAVAPARGMLVAAE